MTPFPFDAIGQRLEDAMTPLEFFDSICGPTVADLLRAVLTIRTVQGVKKFYFGYVEYLKKTNSPEEAVKVARANLAWAIKEVCPRSLYDIWNEGVPKQ